MFEKKMFCTSCGTVGRYKSVNRGSWVLFFFLLLFFVIPGLFYFLYMLTGVRRVCKSCGAESMIPLNSPMAKAALGQLDKRRG